MELKLDESFFREEERDGYPVSEKLKKIWAVELELLVEFDRICNKHRLTYFLDYGTLLGAVRHHGFIPWDDDIDVTMPRRDYCCFCEIVEKETGKEYYFRKGGEEYAVASFSKLMKRGTAAVEVPDAPAEFHQEIFIDIFPLDSVGDGSREMTENWVKMLELWQTIEHPLACLDKIESGGEFFIGNDRVMELVQMSTPDRLAQFESFAIQIADVSNRLNVFPFEMKKFGKSKDRAWYADTVMMNFEGYFFPCPVGYHEVLSSVYGDYMTPVQSRGLHGNTLYDPDKSYVYYLRPENQPPEIRKSEKMIPMSACIITKNESAKLKKCLAALAPYGFEMVVVDTGSEDDTIEMAKQYTESVYEFPWIDDFAAAKNHAVEKAKNDIILTVDSDEYLLECDVENLLRLIKKYPDAVGRVIQKESITKDDGESVETIIELDRLFDRRKYHYAGRIHEQLVQGSVFDENRDDTRTVVNKPGREPIRVYGTGLFFDHEGYAGTDEDRRNKARRNLSMLLDEYEQYPEDVSLIYHIAKSVNLTDGPEAAIPYFEQALGMDLNPALDWVRDMVICYGYALLEVGRYADAQNLEAVYDDYRDKADYVFLMGLIHMNNAGFDLAEEEFLRCVGMDEGRSSGVGSYKAYYNAGVIEECMGHPDKAREFYLLAGNYAPAVEGVARVDVRPKE